MNYTFFQRKHSFQMKIQCYLRIFVKVENFTVLLHQDFKESLIWMLGQP